MNSPSYEVLADVLTTTLGRPAASVGPDTVFGDLQLDSLAQVELSVSLTERLGVQISGVDRDETLGAFSGTLDRLVAAGPAR